MVILHVHEGSLEEVVVLLRLLLCVYFEHILNFDTSLRSIFNIFCHFKLFCNFKMSIFSIYIYQKFLQIL